MEAAPVEEAEEAPLAVLDAANKYNEEQEQKMDQQLPENQTAHPPEEPAESEPDWGGDDCDSDGEEIPVVEPRTHTDPHAVEQLPENPTTEARTLETEEAQLAAAIRASVEEVWTKRSKLPADIQTLKAALFAELRSYSLDTLVNMVRSPCCGLRRQVWHDQGS